MAVGLLVAMRFIINVLLLIKCLIFYITIYQPKNDISFTINFHGILNFPINLNYKYIFEINYQFKILQTCMYYKYVVAFFVTGLFIICFVLLICMNKL